MRIQSRSRRAARRGQAIRRGKGIKTEGRPLLVGIGGSRSGAGKTAVAEALLKHFSSEARKRRSAEKEKNFQPSELPNFSTPAPMGQGWGAIKYTKTAIYASIIDDEDILTQEDKDTQRLFNAGAERVLWVQSPPEGLEEVLPIAVGRLSNLGGIIIEGNSAIEFLKPDIVIFIFGKDEGSPKKSALKIIDMADIILFQGKPPVKLPEKAEKFKVSLSPISGLEGCIEYIDKLLI